jgi:4-amino-4-deoxy-L-arabinose transferase-like glycosyltransferase
VIKKILDKSNILLLLIIFFGACFRFYNFPHQYIFDPDAVRDAIVSIEAAHAHYFPLIGSFSSTGPYTFGPWYYIGIILAQTIVPSIYTPWISLGLASLFTIFFMYKLGETLESKRLGLLLALLTSIAPSEIIAGAGLSNIYPVPLFTTLALFITAKIVKTKAPHFVWYVLLGISLGFAINAHYQALGLMFLPFLLWLYKGWRKYQAPLLVLLGLILTFIPLLLFNLHMHWHTLHGMEVMYLSRGRIYVANSWKIYLLQFWPGLVGFIWGTPFIASIILILCTVVSFGQQIYKRYLPPALLLFSSVLFINFLWLRFYWGERTFSYHYFLEPLIILFTGYMLYSLRRIPYGFIAFVILFATIFLSSLVSDIHRLSPPDPLSEIIKNESAFLEQKYPDNNITIYACNVSPDVHAEGISYLLAFRQTPNAKSKKIAVMNTQCKLPHDTFVLRDTSLIDFSKVPDTALKQASWSAISTNEIFTKTVKWY